MKTNSLAYISEDVRATAILKTVEKDRGFENLRENTTPSLGPCGC